MLFGSREEALARVQAFEAMTCDSAVKNAGTFEDMPIEERKGKSPRWDK